MRLFQTLWSIHSTENVEPRNSRFALKLNECVHLNGATSFQIYSIHDGKEQTDFEMNGKEEGFEFSSQDTGGGCNETHMNAIVKWIVSLS